MFSISIFYLFKFILNSEFGQNANHDVFMSQWLFRGYVHDRCLVGRWRDTVTPVDAPMLEGGFVAYKVAEERGENASCSVDA